MIARWTGRIVAVAIVVAIVVAAVLWWNRPKPAPAAPKPAAPAPAKKKPAVSAAAPAYVPRPKVTAPAADDDWDLP